MQPGGGASDDAWSYTVPGAPAPDRDRLPIVALGALVLLFVVGFSVVRTVKTRVERLTLASDLQSGGIEGEPGATYSFAWVNDDGSPVRWDACTPVHIAVNPAGAPPGAMEDLSEALARIREASGVELVVDGFVDELPAVERQPVQRDRYGDGWAPVLVAWARLDGSPLAAGLGVEDGVLGVASPLAVTLPGDSGILVTGQIVLESAVVVSPGFRTTKSQGAVMLHELSHVLGLGHTPDNAQLLYDGGEPIAGRGELGPGDRAGLAAVGRSAGCLDAPRPEDLD